LAIVDPAGREIRATERLPDGAWIPRPRVRADNGQRSQPRSNIEEEGIPVLLRALRDVVAQDELGRPRQREPYPLLPHVGRVALDHVLLTLLYKTMKLVDIDMCRVNPAHVLVMKHDGATANGAV
jgi:hypothetical protein